VIEREAKEIGGPTYLANRFLVQAYPDIGSVRVVFAEAFTSFADQPAVYRGAFYLERTSAMHLLSLLCDTLGMVAVPKMPPPK
jgi:hypothetical protein